MLFASLVATVAYAQYRNCTLDPNANQIVCPGFGHKRHPQTNYLTTNTGDVLTTNAGEPLLAR
jgi:hypothetical protein